jgi:PilZ domain
VKGKYSSNQNQSAAGSSPADRLSTDNSDLRGHTRYPVSASAEVVEPRTHTRITGRATDLSAGGCYVDTISPLAVGTSVHMRVSAERHCFQTRAIVTYTLTSMGMGLAFRETAADQALILRTWIAELGGEVVDELDLDSEPAFPAEKLAAQSGGLRDIVSEMVGILERKNILSAIEAAALRAKLSE